MILSYSRPESVSWSLDGAGAAFLTDEKRITDGRPSSGTRIQWLSGAQTTSSVLRLRGLWPAAQRVGLCGLVGLTLPAGLRVVISLRRAADAGFTYLPTETVIEQRNDGTRSAWAYIDAQDDVIGVEYAIYNDAGGSSPVAADSIFDVGEAWAGKAANWCIRTNYQDDRKDLSTLKRSLSGQPYPVRRRAEGLSQIEITPILYDAMFGAEGVSDVREQLLAYSACVVVPITAKPYTGLPIDPIYVQRHAKFGYASSIGPITGEAPRWVMSASFTEPPPLL